MIDESGSGQPLLRAARRRGITAIGVQHGDFQAHNPQYTRTGDRPFDVEPAHVFCVWSSWFRERLLRVSPIYEPNQVVVTGRLRYPTTPQDELESAQLRILLLSEASPDFPDEVADYVKALQADPGITVCVQPHPAENPTRWSGAAVHRGSLVAALQACDVAVGVATSALLEALFHHRPAITLATQSRQDPSGYGAEGLLSICPHPEELPSLCRSLTGPQSMKKLEAERARLWGEDAPEALETVLGLCLEG